MARFNASDGPNARSGESPLPGASTNGVHRNREYYEVLRRKLLGKLLLAYLTPLFILAIYFHFIYEWNLRQGIENHLVAVAEDQRNTVDLFLEERIANIKSVFRSELSAELPPEGVLARVLADLRQESPTFVDVGLFDADGTLRRYAGEFEYLLGKDYSQESWFQGINEEGRDQLLSDVFLGFRHQPHFIIAVRRRGSGIPFILRTSVDPVKFTEFVSGHSLAVEGEAFIVNRSGQRQTLTRGEVASPGLLGVPDPSPEAQIVHRGAGGDEYVCAIAWLRLNDWAVVMRVPSAVAFAPIRRARLLIVGILVLAVGLIVLLVFRTTTRISRQLEQADADRDHMQDQLFSAAKLASVGEMAAGVAHEINNPLAIIHEEAGMMLDCLDPVFRQGVDLADFEERLQEISRATIRGRNITGKLLAFSRRHDTAHEEADLNELVTRVLAMKEVEFKVSNIEAVTHLSPQLPTVLVNENQVEQVLLNLLNNARDAMPEGGRITLSTSREGGDILLVVADRGCGMDQELLGRIFFPFVTTKGVGKGTGLGLSISYGIVKSHGGRIEVESKPGQGTKFRIYLPVPVGSTGTPVEGKQ